MDWVAASPLPVLNSAVGVLKTAPHPNAARFFAGWLGTTDGQNIRYTTSGQAIEVGKNAIGTVAERIKTSKPAIIRERTLSILEIRRELEKCSARCGKMIQRPRNPLAANHFLRL